MVLTTEHHKNLKHAEINFFCTSNQCYIRKYNASHSRVAPENVGLQKEQKYNIFACHTCNEIRLCVL
jgi:hypothetical protein